jgi:hypothetical protein
VVRQVNHQRVDRHGSQLPAAFHASALPSKADILVRADHVRFVPKADILGHLILFHLYTAAVGNPDIAVRGVTNAH